MKRQHINLVKLCVGANQVSDLALWQENNLLAYGSNEPKRVRHITRMRPRKESELLAGGSMYWVFKGLILARQRIVNLEKCVGKDGITRCGLILEKELIITRPKLKKPFQGWRYLMAKDAPTDVGYFSNVENEIPNALQQELSKLGVL